MTAPTDETVRIDPRLLLDDVCAEEHEVGGTTFFCKRTRHDDPDTVPCHQKHDPSSYHHMVPVIVPSPDAQVSYDGGTETAP